MVNTVKLSDLGVTDKYLAQHKNSEVVLSGCMVKQVIDSQDWKWVKSTATGSSRDDLISNITVGNGTSKKHVTCYHATQPRNNFTVFYRRLNSTQIIVIGYGQHTAGSNKKYSVDWADGSSSKIDLDKENSATSEFLSNAWLKDNL